MKSMTMSTNISK